VGGNHGKGERKTRNRDGHKNNDSHIKMHEVAGGQAYWEKGHREEQTGGDEGEGRDRHQIEQDKGGQGKNSFPRKREPTRAWRGKGTERGTRHGAGKKC